MDYPKHIALPNGCYWKRGNDELDGIPTADGEIYDAEGNALTCYGCDAETAENLAKAMRGSPKAFFEGMERAATMCDFYQTETFWGTVGHQAAGIIKDRIRKAIKEENK